MATKPPKLGILAGGGALPGQIVQTCRDTGRDFFVIAFEGQAVPGLLADGVPGAVIRLGEAGTGIQLLKEQGCAELVMAGPVKRPTVMDLRPDWRTAKFFGKLGLKALGDDGLLRAVIRELEDEGFTFVGVDQVVGGLLAEQGLYTSMQPDDQAKADIERGLAVARGIGVLDVGQSVVVQQGIVLGVEAVEGTDALIRRCGELRREGPGGVLVKIGKPGQERRADLPTIGTATVRNCAAAGLRGIAIEAGTAIVVDRDAVVAEADKAGLFVLGLPPC